jgi:hypothetical protein
MIEAFGLVEPRFLPPLDEDFRLMGENVYERTFTVVSCDPSQVPAERESGKPLGRHLDGCRIGFDLGASDRKVSAAINKVLPRSGKA